MFGVRPFTCDISEGPRDTTVVEVFKLSMSFVLIVRFSLGCYSEPQTSWSVFEVLQWFRCV